MGEHADDILEGRTCQCCGVFLKEYLTEEMPNGFGYPVSCPECDLDLTPAPEDEG